MGFLHYIHKDPPLKGDYANWNWGKQNRKNNTFIMFTGACDRGNMAVNMGYNFLKHVFMWCKVCFTKVCQLIKQKHQYCVIAMVCPFLRLWWWVKIWGDVWREVLEHYIFVSKWMTGLEKAQTFLFTVVWTWGSAYIVYIKKEMGEKIRICLKKPKWVKRECIIAGRK